MAFTLTCNSTSPLPIEFEGLTPEGAREKSLAEIEKFELLHGNQPLPLAELFQARGNPGDGQWELHGDWSRVHGIGARMTSGSIRIQGSVGRRLGRQMRGGEIHVDGDAGDLVGAEMHGGLIHVHGDAGNLVGAAYRGSPRGMTGGTILIDGNAGHEIGAAMRRGLIAIAGSAGDLVGHNLLAGTVLVLGECGSQPGAGIRRGTLALFGGAPALPSSFRRACISRSTMLALLGQQLERRGFKSGESLGSIRCELYNGDFLAQGRGEILVRHVA